METLVLPTQDQLSQHQYWQRHNVLDVFSPRNPDSSSFISAPSSPLYRSAPLSRSLSGFSTEFPRNPKNGASPVKKPPAAKVGKQNKYRNKIPVENVPKGKPKPGYVKKGTAQKKEESISPPKITILQRPQSREAAMLDLAKITGLPLSEVYIKQGLTPPVEVLEQNKKSSNTEHNSKPKQHPVPKFVKKQEFQLVVKPKQELMVKPKQQLVVKPKQEKFVKKEDLERILKPKQEKFVKKEDLEKILKNEKQESVGKFVKKEDLEQILKEEKQAEQEQFMKLIKREDTKQEQFMKDHRQLVKQKNHCTRSFTESGFLLPPIIFDEKWAGPAFTNSPPPSSLPIPNFPLRKAEGNTRSLALTKPEVDSTQVEFLDTATKGLRRILHLDY